MTLIVLLICILLQRFLGLKSYIWQVNWMDHYFQWLVSKFNYTVQSHGAIGFLIVILPLLIIASLLFALDFRLFSFIGYLILSVLLVWYCLDSRDLKKDPLLGATSADLFMYTYQHQFAIIFWYALFGPVGLVLYFSVNALHEYLQRVHEEQNLHLLTVTAKVQGVLDWVPIRLLGLTYALVGHFSEAFAVIKSQFLSDIRTNEKQIALWGLVAQNGQATIENPDTNETIILMDRALLVWLLVLLILTIAFWLG